MKYITVFNKYRCEVVQVVLLNQKETTNLFTLKEKQIRAKTIQLPNYLHELHPEILTTTSPEAKQAK